MKRRYLYALMFAVPTLLSALIVSVALAAAVAAVLWLFVLGDDTWPAALEPVLKVAFVLASAVLWGVQLSLAYAAGRRQEVQPAFDTRHVWLAVGATAAMLLLLAGYWWRGNRQAPPTDIEICSASCSTRGYVAAGMPPRNAGQAVCSCYDAHGREATRTSMRDVIAASHD